MQTKATSHNKVIFFTVFIIVAIITSLFIFRTSHKSVAAISPNVGVLFPAGRDLKPFDLMTGNQQKFSQKDFLGHWTLLFFGFTHCSSICPTNLTVLDKVYRELHARYPNLQVVLISLDPERDTPEALDTYTRKFNADFIGVTGNLQTLRKLQSQLHVYSQRDETSTQANYQLEHTSSIMLINPQGKWVGLFQFGLTPATFAQNLVIGIKALS